VFVDELRLAPIGGAMANLQLQTDPRLVTTVGDTFADGSAIELVRSASSGRLALLLRSAGKKKTAAQIEHSGCLYRPPNLDEAIVRAMRIPHDVKPYGSIGKLLHRVREIFEVYAGLPKPESALLVAWSASSWFADSLSSPPTLVISGPDTGSAIRLFRLLHCLCRRPVLLGDLGRSALLALAPLGTTLLINNPDLSPKVRALWNASNYRGFHIFGSGKIRAVSSSKAIFLSMANSQEDESVHLALPPTPRDLPPLDERQLEAIARELQPQLLMYRVRNFDEVRKFSPSKLGSTFVGSEVARNLGASVLGEAAIIGAIAPLLQRAEQEKVARRGCDVHSAVIEVMWSPSHADRELGISRLAELTNALLRSRGEILEYSAAEIGWKLKSFGFRRHRNGHGMILQFSQDNRLLLHQLAERMTLKLQPVPDCALCSRQEAVDGKGLM
jgi:hypothetical protein